MALLQNLEDFLAGPGDLDPLIRMAVAHYQFEAIHPFVDGNGRTGRILNILALVQAGLLEIPVLYLSRYIIHNKQEYYRRLRGRDRGGRLGGVAALHAGRGGGDRRLDDRPHPRDPRPVRRDAWRAAGGSCPSRVYSKELVELIFIQPYVRVKFLVDAGIAKRRPPPTICGSWRKSAFCRGEARPGGVSTGIRRCWRC